LLQALDAAIKMYEDLAGKLTAISMVGDLEDKPKTVELTQKKLGDLLGIEISPNQVKSSLTDLGFHTRSVHSNSWEVTVPYWRLDISIEEDLIEEVARMYGYEQIPTKEVPKSQPLQKEDAIFNKIWDLRQRLVKLGLTEVQTYSFYSTAVIAALGWDNEASKEKYLVKVANPISSETEYLRQSIWPNLVEVVGKNLRKGFKDIAIFEIGKAFNVGADGNPKEDYRVAIALSNGTDNPLAELYHIAQELNLHPKGAKLKHLFHPKRQIGNLAEVHLRMLNKFGIEKRVAVLEIELEALV